MRGLDGKSAIVTGGGGGIGSAICRRLGEEGCRVGVLDIDPEAANKAVALIAAAGGKALPLQADITSFESVKRTISAFETDLGPTDILINNAGWDRVGKFLDSDPDLWRRIVDINLWGPLHLHRVVAAGMAERRRGRIVNIASDAGRVGSSGEAVYSACKGGIIAFSKTLARELASRNINVNVVCPGPTETALLQSFRDDSEYGEKIYQALSKAIPFRRFGAPEDIPGIVAFLASDDAAFITGQVISVSGGLTMAG